MKSQSEKKRHQYANNSGKKKGTSLISKNVMLFILNMVRKRKIKLNKCYWKKARIPSLNREAILEELKNNKCFIRGQVDEGFQLYKDIDLLLSNFFIYLIPVKIRAALKGARSRILEN